MVRENEGQQQNFVGSFWWKIKGKKQQYFEVFSRTRSVHAKLVRDLESRDQILFKNVQVHVFSTKIAQDPYRWIFPFPLAMKSSKGGVRGGLSMSEILHSKPIFFHFSFTSQLVLVIFDRIWPCRSTRPMGKNFSFWRWNLQNRDNGVRGGDTIYKEGGGPHRRDELNREAKVWEPWLVTVYGYTDPVLGLVTPFGMLYYKGDSLHPYK